MHTQRQSYLFKNRSRSPQFSRAEPPIQPIQHYKEPAPLSLLVIPLCLCSCCCETNKYPRFSSNNQFHSECLECGVYPSTLCIAIARQVSNQLKHSLYYCCGRWASNRKNGEFNKAHTSEGLSFEWLLLCSACTPSLILFICPHPNIHTSFSLLSPCCCCLVSSLNNHTHCNKKIKIYLICYTDIFLKISKS